MNEAIPNSKYPTPIMDAIRDKYAGDPSCEDYRTELEEACVNLERQLAKVTEQRDMLTEALQESQLQLGYLNEKHPRGTTTTIMVRNGLVLAAVKGESNE